MQLLPEMRNISSIKSKIMFWPIGVDMVRLEIGEEIRAIEGTFSRKHYVPCRSNDAIPRITV
jgi:hypothetical protein